MQDKGVDLRNVLIFLFLEIGSLPKTDQRVKIELTVDGIEQNPKAEHINSIKLNIEGHSHLT